MTRFLWLLLIPVLLLIYPWLIRPNQAHRDWSTFTGVDYAHRGLWDQQRPENSLAAFEAAAEAGFGIELDVRLTRDGQLVIHHDASLARMCGEALCIEETDLATLRRCRLLDTDQQIPTLAEVLTLIAGRVPLILELKAAGNAADLASAVHQQMQSYTGVWCVESFHPSALLWFRRHAPQVIRGQLTFDHRGQPGRSLTIRLRDFFIASMLGNALSRPDFIASEAATEQADRLPMCLLRQMQPRWVAWTIRSPEELAACRDRYDLIIFEGFQPDAI